MSEIGEAACYVPGEWECPTCGFTLSKNYLHARTGAVSTNNEDVREVCPNDGVTLRRLTWEARALSAEKIALECMKEHRQLQDAAMKLVEALERTHGPLDGSVSYGGQKVDGFRCDEPFSVRYAMRALRALASAPPPDADG